MSGIREEFEKAFRERFTLSTGVPIPSITGYAEALWAAKWMAERICNHAEQSCGSDKFMSVDDIRKLAKELDQ